MRFFLASYKYRPNHVRFNPGDIAFSIGLQPFGNYFVINWYSVRVSVSPCPRKDCGRILVLLIFTSVFQISSVCQTKSYQHVPHHSYQQYIPFLPFSYQRRLLTPVSNTPPHSYQQYTLHSYHRILLTPITAYRSLLSPHTAHSYQHIPLTPISSIFLTAINTPRSCQLCRGANLYRTADPAYLRHTSWCNRRVVGRAGPQC